MLAFWKLTGMQAKLFLREPPAFFFTLVFPSLLVIVFGSIFGNRPRTDWGTTLGYVDMMVPGFIAVLIASVALMGIPIATAALREYKVLRRYRATPLHPATYLAADVVMNFGMTVVGVIILVATGRLIFNLRFDGNPFYVALGFTLSALAFFAFGYVVASVAPTARMAQALGQILFFPLMFLSGGAIPVEIMPERVRSVSDVLPLTHVVVLMRGLWLDRPIPDLTTHVAVLTVLLFGSVLLATRLFRWE